jgi:hypothetical protein
VLREDEPDSPERSRQLQNHSHRAAVDPP